MAILWVVIYDGRSLDGWLLNGCLFDEWLFEGWLFADWVIRGGTRTKRRPRRSQETKGNVTRGVLVPISVGALRVEVLNSGNFFRRRCRLNLQLNNATVAGNINIYMVIYLFIPFIILALLSPSLPAVTQIRGHMAGPPSPSPLRYVPSFYCEKNSAICNFFPCRLASNCTYPRCQALSAVDPFLWVLHFCK